MSRHQTSVQVLFVILSLYVSCSTGGSSKESIDSGPDPHEDLAGIDAPAEQVDPGKGDDFVEPGDPGVDWAEDTDTQVTDTTSTDVLPELDPGQDPPASDLATEFDPGQDPQASDLVEEYDAGSEPQPPDLPSDIVEETDSPVPEVPGDEATIDAAQMCPGAPGCACIKGAECVSGVCVETMAGFECGRECAGGPDCPAGWDCSEVSTSLGVKLVCTAPYRLCQPCRVDTDCDLGGGNAAHCMAYASEGSFCAVPCAMGGKDCPEGFDCVTADRGDGKGFCRPTGGAPCPCTPKFQDQGFTTDCFVSNDFGTCKASRTCDQTCPAATPASESCNGVDDDCDGTIDPEASAGCLVFFEDQDNDGHGKPGSARCLCAPEGPYRAAIGDDCDDGQTGVNPDATESCNGKDDDCDGVTDEESSSGCTEYYRDEDKDGFGTAGNPACRCLPGDGYTATQAGDCDDQDPTRNPGQPESCNGADDDCDGLTDEPDATGCELFYADQDQDGFGDPGDGLCLCAATLDHATRNKADCNDQDGDIHPGVVESCNGLDDDCDGTADPAGTQGCVSYCVDADGDGYGVTTQVACLCKPDAVHSVKLPGDCDDANVLINPGVAEDCATPADDDCDGSSNEPDAAHCLAFFWDADGDGWGTDEARCLCAASGAYRAEKSGDCDDTNAKANPGVQEDCATAFDDDCDGKSGEEGALGCVDYFEDADRDGFGSPGGLPRCLCGPMEPYLAVTPGDCDDSAPQINPGQAETCGNLTDDDCDGETDEAGATGCVEMFRDEDGDGYGVAGDAKCLCKPSAPYTAPEPGDCRDQDPAVNPRQAEVCGDSLDNDCDAKTDEEGASGCVVYYKDLDGDGSGVTADSRCLCSPTSGYTSAKPGDCNDMDPEIRPGKVELCGDKKDNDCNGATDEEGATGCKTYRRDADKDGFGVKEDTKCLCEPWTPYTVMDLPLIASDCDDSNKALNPGVLEQCNGIDDNCDGVTDQPGITGCHTYYQDKDGDGCAGAPAGSKCLCNGEGDFTATEQCDCNDTDPMVNTRMPEICGNGKDDNCMLGEQDENALGCLMYYRDNDGDGYGVLPGKCFCSFVSPYSVTKPGDCNDSNKNVYPGHGC